MIDALTRTAGRLADRVFVRLVPQIATSAAVVIECRCRGGVAAEACRHKIGYYCRQRGTNRPWTFRGCCVA